MGTSLYRYLYNRDCIHRARIYPLETGEKKGQEGSLKPPPAHAEGNCNPGRVLFNQKVEVTIQQPLIIFSPPPSRGRSGLRAEELQPAGGRGMGSWRNTHPHPNPPLEGEGAQPDSVHRCQGAESYDPGNHEHFFGPWQAQPQRAAWAVRRAVSIGPIAAT
jgi:hypothetical protein